MRFSRPKWSGVCLNFTFQLHKQQSRRWNTWYNWPQVLWLAIGRSSYSSSWQLKTPHGNASFSPLIAASLQQLQFDSNTRHIYTESPSHYTQSKPLLESHHIDTFTYEWYVLTYVRHWLLHELSRSEGFRFRTQGRTSHEQLLFCKSCSHSRRKPKTAASGPPSPEYGLYYGLVSHWCLLPRIDPTGFMRVKMNISVKISVSSTN